MHVSVLLWNPPSITTAGSCSAAVPSEIAPIMLVAFLLTLKRPFPALLSPCMYTFAQWTLFSGRVGTEPFSCNIFSALALKLLFNGQQNPSLL